MVTSPNESRAETARNLLISNVPTTGPASTVRDVLATFRHRSFADVSTIYVLDEDARLVGIVSLADVVSHPPEARLSELMKPTPLSVGPEMDQERVASLALGHDIASVPVVDEAGVFIGVVPPHALLDVLRREHIEDLHRLVGMRRDASHARQALEEPAVRRARDRLPWLLLGLAGSALATFVMSRFEGQLQQNVTLVFFVPAIVYLVDAIGTQSETVAVRGLSLSHAPVRGLLRGELATGLLIGLTFAGIAFAGVALAFADPRLAAVVALTILIAGTMATTIGFLLPWLLDRLGQDPAFGSGPVGTIVQDILSLLVYFSLGSWLLG